MKLKLFLGALAALLAGGCDRETSGPRIAVYDQPQVGLVVIDAQKDFLEATGRLPVDLDQVGPMLAATNRLIDGAPSSGVDVVYVRSEFPPGAVFGNWVRRGAALENQPGAALDPRLSEANDRVFSKRRSDAFSNADLDAYFRGHAIDHLVLVGARVDASVYYTALGAMNRGYKVKVVSDAVAAASAARRDRALEALRRRGAEIITTEPTLADWARRKKYLDSH